MRLFVAVWPPPPVVTALAELERPSGGPVRWAAPARWHITLVFLGDPTSGGPVGAAATRLAGAPVDGHAGTVARLGTATGTFGRSVLFVPVFGLDALARSVRAAYVPAGAPPADAEPAPFHGHLTVGRARRRRDDVRPWAGQLIGAAGGMEWTVDELALVASVSEGGRGRYETVATRPVPRPHHPTSNMRSGLQ
ncbi:MAG: RNA 2',3'-cyclic phosphodiesterase [Acidimicrobiales bacterium]